MRSQRVRLYVMAVLIFIGAIGVAAMIDPLRSAAADPRAAYKAFATQVANVVGPCDRANRVATDAFNAAGDGGDALLLAAYRAAGTARHACSMARASMATVHLPNALSGGVYGLDNICRDLTTALTARSAVWQQAQGVLQDTHNLALQSAMLDSATKANRYEKRANDAFAKVATTLHMPRKVKG